MPRRLRHWTASQNGKLYVYFVQGETTELIKIGITSQDINLRIMDMQCGSPDRLTLLGIMCVKSRVVEKVLHKHFASTRVHGEWFRPSPELLEYIAEYTRRTQQEARTRTMIRKGANGLEPMLSRNRKG